jgi:hypothetical protein
MQLRAQAPYRSTGCVSVTIRRLCFAAAVSDLRECSRYLRVRCYVVRSGTAQIHSDGWSDGHNQLSKG